LSSADFEAGGTLDVHTTTKTQKSSTFNSLNQHFTNDDSDIHSRKKLMGKLTKVQQFFSNLEIEVGDKQQEIEQLGTLLKIKNESEG
jgi:hypothetical protein